HHHASVASRPIRTPSLTFFNHPAPTAIYTLSLHDALPISSPPIERPVNKSSAARPWPTMRGRIAQAPMSQPPRPTRRLRHGRLRSEEHTSELQSLAYLVCRLLLEKKKNKTIRIATLTHKSD